jgi:NSS family neurotransmitter:Na+ symporter
MQEQWRSRTGFILATIGAAVGLGNIWRFAYVAGENGGAVFLLVYLVFVVLIGLPLVVAELSLGRRGGSDAVTAFERAAPASPWRFAGWIGVVGGFLILSYYAVIAGWALKYFFGAVTGGLWAAAEKGYGSYFEGFIANAAEPVLWQALMLIIAASVVARGVNAGIERINAWLMPLLALIVVGLALFALTLPGSGRGVTFLLAPDWGAFGRPTVYLNALGQAFFSLGVGMAVFVTYGSYVGRNTRLPASAAAIVAGDTLFAIVAGLAIFPAVFALGGDPGAGPRLAFITFPQILLEMPAGRWIGIAFFFLLSAAAVTSMISLLEVPVAYVVSRLGHARPLAASVVAGTIFILGIPSALSYGVLTHVHFAGQPLLDGIDQAVSNFLLPAGGLVVALLVGWRLNARTALEDADLAAMLVGQLWLWLLRVAVPLVIVIILMRSLQLF